MFRTINFVRDIFKKYPALLITSTLLVLFVSAIEACSLFTVGPLVDFLIHPDLTGVSPLTAKVIDILNFFGIPLVFSYYLIIFIAFILIASVLRILATYILLRAKQAMLRDIFLGTFQDFFNARWHFFASNKQGVLLNTFIHEFRRLSSAFTTISYFFTHILQFIFYLAIPFYISWQVTAISLLATALLSAHFILLGKISYRLGRTSTLSSNRMSQVIGESFNLAKIILGFGRQTKSAENLKSAFNEHYKAEVNFLAINRSVPILYRSLGVIVLAVALFTARIFKVPIAETAVLLLALLQVVIVMGSLTMKKNSLDNVYPSYEQVKNLRKRAQALAEKKGGRQFDGFNKEITMENVTFAYPGHEPVLKNITLRIPKSRMIAIVGESGVGKSTLIDVIMGFNKPTSGKVLFDSTDLSEFNITSYREHLGYVPQDAVLFNMSIRDNLLWANEKATVDEIKHAARQANADEFIERFPKSYDSLVGDRGVRLSGGQRQRVALARAILRKPNLLILDEATSALDTRSERLIQRAIENIARETTIIVIAHRLSTIVHADYIYVLKDGKVAEEGTYGSLASGAALFKRMVELQLL